MESPPIAVSATQEFLVTSRVDAKIVYVLKTMQNPEQPEATLVNRKIQRQRRPLIQKMREMILSFDFSEWYDARDRSRIKEVTEALMAEAMGLEDEDYEFLADVEAVIQDQSPEYYDLAIADEDLNYQLRLYNLATLLYAIDKDGDRYHWPPRSLQQRYQYLRACDPRDILALTLEGANLLRLTEEAEKNFEPPSTSGTDPSPSSAENVP